MTCVECGKVASYWLCSNACALAYAKKRGRRDCSICSYDAETGRIGRHDTNKICSDCRRQMENVDWVVARNQIPSRAVDRQEEGIRLLREEYQHRPLMTITPLVSEIVRQIVEGERIAMPQRDRQGRSRGVRYRWRAYTARRLATKLGCSPVLVQRVIDEIEGANK